MRYVSAAKEVVAEAVTTIREQGVKAWATTTAEVAAGPPAVWSCPQRLCGVLLNPCFPERGPYTFLESMFSGASLGRLWPTWAAPGRTLVPNFGRTFTDIGQGSAEFGENRPNMHSMNVGRGSTKSSRPRIKPGLVSTKLGPISTKLGPNWKSALDHFYWTPRRLLPGSRPKTEHGISRSCVPKFAFSRGDRHLLPVLAPYGQCCLCRKVGQRGARIAGPEIAETISRVCQ